MALTIWNPLLLDRIHMTVGVSGKTLYGASVSRLYSIKAKQAILVPNGKIVVVQGNYITRIDYYPDKNRDKVAEIELGSTKSKYKYFKLSLYSSKFKAGEFESLKKMLAQMLPEFNYQKLYYTAKVSYIELAADTRSHDKHGFIPFRSRCNKSHIDPHNGYKGATYLGSEDSSLFFSIYDKHKQLVDKKQVTPHAVHTRIELRQRYTGLSPCELLAGLKNQFVKLEVADLHGARQASKEKAWQIFIDRCLVVGSADALAALPKKQRTAYMKLLRANAAWWWKPQHVWKNLPHALSVIVP